MQTGVVSGPAHRHHVAVPRTSGSGQARMWPTGSFAAQLPADDLRALCALGRPVRFEQGMPLMVEGEFPDSVVLVSGGLVKVIVCDSAGQDHLLGVRGPGELVGEMSCLSGGRRTASVVALGPVSAIKIPRRPFLNFLMSRPAVGLRMVGQVSARLRASDRRRFELSSDDVGLRLARTIRNTALIFHTVGGASTPEIPLSQDELAQLINAAQASVQRALRQLRNRQLVTTGYRKVAVPCMPCLERVVAAAESGDGKWLHAATGCGGRLAHRASSLAPRPA